MKTLPLLKTQAVLVLFSCSFRDCNGNLNGGGSRARRVGPGHTKQPNDENLKSIKDFAAKEGTAALIGAGLGVAATVVSQQFHKKHQLYQRQHHDQIRNFPHQAKPKHFHHVEDGQKLSKQRVGALSFLPVLAFTVFGAVLCFNGEFREQAKQLLSTAHSPNGTAISECAVENKPSSCCQQHILISPFRSENGSKFS